MTISVPNGFKDLVLENANRHPKHPMNVVLLGNINVIKNMNDEECYNFLWMLGFRSSAQVFRDKLRRMKRATKD